MPIYWNPQLFKLNIEPLDQQHQNLFAALNKLHDSYNENAEDSQIPEMLRFLKNYTQKHFQDEEKLMAHYDYPGLAEQQAAHAFFIKDLEEIQNQFMLEGPSKHLLISICNKLTAWLVDHISGLDKQMGAYIHKQREHS